MAALYESWNCDGCGCTNDADEFPCRSCGYPLRAPAEPAALAGFLRDSKEDYDASSSPDTDDSSQAVYEGVASSVAVPWEERTQDRARRSWHAQRSPRAEPSGVDDMVAAASPRNEEIRGGKPPPLELELRSLPEHLQHAMAAPGEEHVWQCEMCLLITSEPPCVCCGYDPSAESAEADGVSQTEQVHAMSKARLDLYPEQLKSAAAMLAVPEDNEEAAAAARRLAMELSAAAKIIAAPEGSDLGPVPVRGGGFRFRVWAPNALKVELAGDFNQWACGELETQLLPEADGEHWRLVVPEAIFGHRYRFRVHFDRDTSKMMPLTPTSKDQRASEKRGDSQVRRAWRADPYSPVIEVDATLRGVYNSVLYNHNAFQWEDANFERPAIQNVVLYEIHVPTFATHTQNLCGTFRSTAERLDYLAELGINGLCLMPFSQDVHPNPKEEFCCWGYDPLSFFAVSTTYGTPDDLKALVNEAHKRNMIVIFDFVANHMSSRNILQWWDGTNLYFSDDGTEWGPQPKYDDPRVQNHIIDAVLSFFRDYHFDGIRMDSTSNIRGIGRDIPGGWQLLQKVNDAIHDRFPHAITIAEDLYDDDRLTAGGACFDFQWGQGYFKTLYQAATSPTDKYRGILEVCQRLEHVHPGPIGGRVLYTENHDTVPGDRERRIPVAITRGVEGIDPRDNFFALKRSTLIACIMICSPGMPMILQGQEFVELASPEWPEGPQVDWTNRIRMDGIFRLYQDMIRIRKNAGSSTLGLTSPRTRVHHINAEANIFAMHRFDKGGEGDDVIVVVNASNTNFKSYRIGFPREGSWTVRLNTHDATYHELYSMTGTLVPPSLLATPHEPRDGYPFSGSLPIPKYSVVVLSQNGVSCLVFRVKHETVWGDVLCVCGSTSALGDWKVPEPLYTDAADVQYPWWQSKPFMVPASEVLEFKIVLRKADGSLVWEERENRTVLPDRGRHLLLLLPEF